MIVLLSGGLDSSLALCWALERGAVDLALTVNYGQSSNAEIAAAASVATAARVPHKVWNCFPPMLVPTVEGGMRATPDKSQLPEIETFADALLPGRNLFLLSLAGIAAGRLGSDSIVVGCCKEDARDFPDCRYEFLIDADSAIWEGLGRKGSLLTPWIHVSKAEMIRTAHSFPHWWSIVQHTWSCYTPLPAERGKPRKPCQRCPACVQRAKAFADAGLGDPALCL